MRRVWWIWRDDDEDDDLFGLEESKCRERERGARERNKRLLLVFILS